MKSKILSIFIILCISAVALLFAHGNMTKATIGFLKITKNLTITAAGLFNAGSDGNGIDVQFFTDTATEEFLWDASANGLFLDGTNAANVLTLTDGNLSVTDDIDVDGITNLDVTDIDGAVDMATTLLVTGVSTLTGGVIFPSMSTAIWSNGGSVVLATSGTDATPTNGPRMWVGVQIPYNVTLTGIGYLVGSVGGTDSVIVELYNSSGTIVARSVSGNNNLSDLVATTAQFQKVPFSSTAAVVAGKYYISVQFNGNTARVRTFGIPNSGFVANTAAGTYSTGASITPGTTFVAGEGPISFVY